MSISRCPVATLIISLGVLLLVIASLGCSKASRIAVVSVQNTLEPLSMRVRPEAVADSVEGCAAPLSGAGQPHCPPLSAATTYRLVIVCGDGRQVETLERSHFKSEDEWQQHVNQLLADCLETTSRDEAEIQ